MKFLILNTDYSEFLSWLYAQRPGLENQPYEEQMRVRVESLFAVSDFCSRNVRKLGNEAWDIHVNNEFMQKASAKEHGNRITDFSPGGQRWQELTPRVRQMAGRMPNWYLKPLIRSVRRTLGTTLR